MKTPTNTAVVGLGIGMAHVAGYLDSPGANLVAVADAWAPRRERVGGTFSQGSMLSLRPLFNEALLDSRWEDLGVRVYDDVQAIVDDSGIDLVSLCTPDDTHEPYGIMLLEAGKHLLLEKPVALSVEAAGRLAAAARANDRRISVGYEMRVNPAVLKIRELIGAGLVGNVRAFSLYQYRGSFRRDKWQKWIQERDRSGGLLVEETCHWFDLARFLTGREVTHVHCVGTDLVHADFDYEDIAFIQGSYADGSAFQIGHSLTGFDFSLVIQVYGDGGSIWCGLKAAPHSLLDGGQSTYMGIVSWGPVNAAPGDGSFVTFGDEVLEGESIRDNVAHTVNALREGTPFTAEFDDGLRSLQIALAARYSLESGTPVEVDQT
ncbi:MAG: Gfo/Idh/MocA family oxidoreductase [Spirochaetales bacterium]|nr:Gfo/Idh/MocA family oxidoreductase [Spirochaetales bacterium]